MRLLTGEREAAPDVLQAQLARVAPADGDAPALGVEEPEEEVRDGRLARSARPDESDALSRLDA